MTSTNFNSRIEQEAPKMWLLEKIALLEEEISQLKMSIQIPLDDGTEMLNNNNDSTDADNLTYESQYNTDDTGGEFYINGGQ